MKTAPRLYRIATLLLTISSSFTLACKSKPAPPPEPAKLVIIKATWGATDDSASADVTNRVTELVKDNALEVQAISQVFGDPAAFKMKELRVEYTKGGVFAKKRASENDTLRIPVDEKPVPIRLVIRKALYGNLESEMTADVTKRVGDLVVDNALTVTPTNGLFGDPAPFKAKELRVDYTFDGVEKSKRAVENMPLTISASGQ
jgi:hypothetical protein